MNIFSDKRLFFKYLKRSFLLIFSACLLIVLFIRGFSWLTDYKRPQFIGESIMRVETQEKVVALTYDDGPLPPYTDQILDVLKESKVKATFFVVGENVQKYPKLTQRIYQEGHEIGNHSWSHKKLILRGPSFVECEIEKTDNLLRSLGYTGPIHFRAPYGRKLIALPWVLSKLQKKHILFNVAAMDWEDHSLDYMLDRIRKQIRPGSIVLLHDGVYDTNGDRFNTVSLTRFLIDILKQDGYKLLTISELIKLSDLATRLSNERNK